MSLPQNEWNTFRGLSKDKLNILYCYSEVCHLAAKAAVKFASAGFPVMEMDGRFKAWKASPAYLDPNLFLPTLDFCALEIELENQLESTQTIGLQFEK